MMLHALILTYNSIEGIVTCLKSLEGKVDDIYILDNKWIGYEDDTDFENSTDGTLEVIMVYADKSPTPILLKVDRTRKHQYQARNSLLERIPEGDWVLCIDSDEMIINWIPDLKNKILEDTTEIGYRICGKSQSIPYETGRLMCKIFGLHYSENHRLLQNSIGEIIDPRTFPILKDIQLIHQPIYDKKHTRKAMIEYEYWLHDWEAVSKFDKLGRRIE